MIRKVLPSLMALLLSVAGLFARQGSSQAYYVAEADSCILIWQQLILTDSTKASGVLEHLQRLNKESGRVLLSPYLRYTEGVQAMMQGQPYKAAAYFRQVAASRADTLIRYKALEAQALLYTYTDALLDADFLIRSIDRDLTKHQMNEAHKQLRAELHLLRAVVFLRNQAIYKAEDITSKLLYARLYFVNKRLSQLVAFADAYLAEVYRVKGEHQRSVLFLRQASYEFQKEKNLMGMALVRLFQANAQVESGETTQADAAYREAVDLAAQVPNSYLEIICRLKLAENMASRELYAEAIAQAERAFTMSQICGDRASELNATIILAKCYYNLGRYPQAYSYQQLHSHLQNIRNSYIETRVDSLVHLREQEQSAIWQKDYEDKEEKQKAENVRLWYAIGGFMILIPPLLLLIFLLFLSRRKARRLVKELKKANDDLSVAMAELAETQNTLVQSEKMAMMGQLIAGITHEINNPINFVYNGINALERNILVVFGVMDRYDKLPTEAGLLSQELERVAQEKLQNDYDERRNDIQGLIRDVKKGALRIRDIVKGMYNFASDAMFVADVHEDIESAIVLLQGGAYKDTARIERSYDTSIAGLYASHGQLNQLFMNLIANALQAVASRYEDTGQGRINIVTEQLANHKSGKKYVKIRIIDNGIGMNTSVKSKIFDAFFSTKEVGHGTGLGLYISYQIVKRHKGVIEVYSEPGQGCEFIVTLPVLSKTQ